MTLEHYNEQSFTSLHTDQSRSTEPTRGTITTRSVSPFPTTKRYRTNDTSAVFNLCRGTIMSQVGVSQLLTGARSPTYRLIQQPPLRQGYCSDTHDPTPIPFKGKSEGRYQHINLNALDRFEIHVGCCKLMLIKYSL